jgi:hypothetical protein
MGERSWNRSPSSTRGGHGGEIPSLPIEKSFEVRLPYLGDLGENLFI